jgi:hypothetical protein
MIVEFVIEAITYRYTPMMPVWPYNLIILIVFISLMLIANKFTKFKIIKWLSSIPAAISSISVFTIIVLLMGFIQQVRKPGFIDLIGLTDVVKSWAYLLCSIYLLLVLGLF